MTNLNFSIFLAISSIFLSGFMIRSNSNETEILDWDDLAKVDWVLEDYYYKAIFNDVQKELHGKEVIVHGFMFPLEYSRKHSLFLVSSAPMGMCFFCGPGEAESMVYVQTKEPIDYIRRPMKVKGVFKLVEDTSMGILYELQEAELVH